jgi:hypothetical protein
LNAPGARPIRLLLVDRHAAFLAGAGCVVLGAIIAATMLRLPCPEANKGDR